MNILNSGKNGMFRTRNFSLKETGKFYVTNMALGMTYPRNCRYVFGRSEALKTSYEQNAEYRNSTVCRDVSLLYYKTALIKI